MATDIANKIGSVLFYLAVTAFVVALVLPMVGCTSLPAINEQTIEARAAAHAAMIRQAQETLKEAEDWRRLALEAEASAGGR